MKTMTTDEFNDLDEETQNVLIFQSEKITETRNTFVKFELFKIDNLYIETKTSLINRLKRHINTYTFNDLPLYYAGFIQAYVSVK